MGGEISLGRGTNSFGAIVQGAGFARRLSVIDFLKETSQSLKLRTVIDLYLAVRLGQLGQSAACEHFHRIGPRLAKWLLMSQDRAPSATFSVIHEFIALMLEIRRVGVTTPAANFKRRGLIEYHRGGNKDTRSDRATCDRIQLLSGR